MNQARTFALDFHADYRCKDAGACCTSGWQIPVEPEIEDGIRISLAVRKLRAPGEPAAAELLRPMKGLPSGSRSVLGMDASGRCRFHESEPRRGCSLHRQLGHEALPASCRHFPRVCLHTPRGTFVSLSHYCPTAARQLFRSDASLRIVENPEAFPASVEYGGLDARTSLPPFLRPGMLLDWDGHEMWQRHAVATFAREDLLPEAAVSLLSRQVERARAWLPGDGVFLEFLQLAFEEDPQGRGAFELTVPAVRAAWEDAVGAVPQGVCPPRWPHDFEASRVRHVDPGWSAQHAPIRRYLASKAFASWLALQGQGLRTVARGLQVATAVLLAECARACAAHDRGLDDALLEQAFRASDLLLVHLASPQALARRLSAVEEQDGPHTTA
jgi:Fe-S-cluster containining protein